PATTRRATLSALGWATAEPCCLNPLTSIASLFVVHHRLGRCITHRKPIRTSGEKRACDSTGASSGTQGRGGEPHPRPRLTHDQGDGGGAHDAGLLGWSCAP